MSDAEFFQLYSSLPLELQKEVKEYIEYLITKKKKKSSNKPKRKAGIAKGKIRIKEGFDDPLPDFQEYT